MSTATATAVEANGVDATIEAYLATWNEPDPARRRAGIARAWAEAGRYRDPVMASDGPAEMDAMLAGVQAKFPGFVLRRTSKVDAHNGAAAGGIGLVPGGDVGFDGGFDGAGVRSGGGRGGGGVVRHGFLLQVTMPGR